MTETPPETRARLRGAARISAVQALYQMEITGRGAKGVILEFRNHRFGAADEPGDFLEADEAFFEDLVAGAVDHQDGVDEMIRKRLSEKWRLSRIDSTIRAILRAAVFELAHREDVPARTVIDEYVEIARDFFDGDEPGFVNALLDAVARDCRGGELALP